jgi:glutaconate CoA-transferase subunit A
LVKKYFTILSKQEREAMREKLFSMEEAAGWVKDGCLLGFTSAVLEDAPMAFLRELVRRRVKNLRLTTLPGGGLNVDFLIGAGVVAEYETSHCSLGHLGPAPNFQRALKSGVIKIKDST